MNQQAMSCQDALLRCSDCLFVVVVNSHVCLLKKRPDPSHDGTLRWSLPYDEICHCQKVVRLRLQTTCPRKEDQTCSDTLSCNMWFADNSTLLTQRKNWNNEVLDRLLQRADYCSECNMEIASRYCVTNKQSCFHRSG